MIGYSRADTVFLEDQGYEVITASDGIDGIAVFLKDKLT